MDSHGLVLNPVWVRVIDLCSSGFTPVIELSQIKHVSEEVLSVLTQEEHPQQLINYCSFIFVNYMDKKNKLLFL